MSKRRFGGSNGFGHVPDPIHNRTPAYHLLRAGAPAQLPDKTSLESSVRYVLDQGATSSCTGRCIANGIDVFFNHRGQTIEFPSADGIYKVGRCVDRTPNVFGKLEPLRDDGAMPNQVMRGLFEWGVHGDSNPLTVPDPATINDEPTLEELEADSEFELDGWYGIDREHNILSIETFRQAIYQGFPVPFAVFVDHAFEDWSGWAPLGTPDPGDILGSHYILGTSYETDSKGRIVIGFLNSWSCSWGRNGFGRGYADTFGLGMRDVYVMDLKRRVT